MMINVLLAHGTPREQAMRDHLILLPERHNVNRWQITDVVCIDQSVTPHSHPTLTLNTDHLNDDAWLLATYLHEQLHWYCGEHEAVVTQTIADLRTLYPVVPVGLPDGARSEFSSYLHLIIGWLEFTALAELFGPEEARQVIAGWIHYTWIHGVVLQDSEVLGSVIRRHCLLP